MWLALRLQPLLAIYYQGQHYYFCRGSRFTEVCQEEVIVLIKNAVFLRNACLLRVMNKAGITREQHSRHPVEKRDPPLRLNGHLSAKT